MVLAVVLALVAIFTQPLVSEACEANPLSYAVTLEDNSKQKLRLVGTEHAFFEINDANGQPVLRKTIGNGTFCLHCDAIRSDELGIWHFDFAL